MLRMKNEKIKLYYSIRKFNSVPECMYYGEGKGYPRSSKDSGVDIFRPLVVKTSNVGAEQKGEKVNLEV